MVTAETDTYGRYGRVVKLSNGTADVMVTTDLGPRIIYYGLSGAGNVLGELTAEDVVETALGQWHPWGGHRLWTAPEANPRSYAPDNDPVEYELLNSNAVRVKAEPEREAGVQKEMLITLASNGTRTIISHRITNVGLWPIELAPWGLTIVKGGGTTIFPQEPFAPHTECLLPTRPLVLWSYTDLTDPRWTFGKKLIRLRCDPLLDYPQKIGAAVKAGWAAYIVEDLVFVKRFDYFDKACYPDFGCNFETFTKGDFMEIETLGPLAKLEPGETASHTEDWFLFEKDGLSDDEESLAGVLESLVRQCERAAGPE